MNSKALILLCTTTVVLSACSSKKGPHQPHQIDPARIERLYADFIARWDYNQDGLATCEDISVKRSRLDEDWDGYLTSREYRHARFEDKSFMFYEMSRIDSDANRLVTLAEFMAVPHSQFLNMDLDKNCTINRQEAVIALRGQSLEMKEQQRGKKGKGKRQKK